MTEELELERIEIIDQAEKESEISDLKQHADKMIRGFENFNNFSSNRAIWELVQNACDLTNECKIEIDYRNNGFSFSHNGKPFTTKSLISLIKQVSGKYGEESELPEVGKYGTGFLTTHTFGRKFKINSYLYAKGHTFQINDFLIDRSPKDWETLANKIRIQKNDVFELIKKVTPVQTENIKTTFTFIPETDQEFKYIQESSKDLDKYIPIVLAINERLKEVIIQDDLKVSKYSFLSKEHVTNEKNINLYKTTIQVNEGSKIIVYSIIDNESEIEIVLPINERNELFEFSNRIAKLFLYYPLVGSEDFGINFIINCKKFLPTEPRNGIHLNSNKDQVKEQEEANRIIIEKSSELIFSFLESNIINVPDPLLYAKINFKRDSDNDLLNQYFKKLQTTWTERFKSLPIVETISGFKTVNESCFFSEELILPNTCPEEIFSLATKFYNNIPVRNKIELWSKYVSDWNNDEIEFIGHKNLVEKISGNKLEEYKKEELIKYYNLLLLLEKDHFFSDYMLLPNIDNEFQCIGNLIQAKDITPELINAGRVLIPESIKKIIHNDFIFDFKLDIFNRKSFSSNIKSMLDNINANEMVCLPVYPNETHYNTNIHNIKNNLEFTFIFYLIDYCKMSNRVDSESKPILLIKKICEYYSLNQELIHLPNIEEKEENIDPRAVRKILAQIFFNVIELHNDQWVKDNIDFMLDIVNCNEDSLKEVFSNSKIYPNQNFELKYISSLKRDINIAEEIKDLYNKVTKKDIRDSLICRQFNEHVSAAEFIDNKKLTTEIEEVFFSTDINSINSHPFKTEILEIIAKIRNKEFADLFPRLDDKKANLMLEIVTNEKTKDDIFSIVTLNESQINKLGKLVKGNNFEAILNKATELLENEQQLASDFRHKYEIGTHIEDLIRQKLSNELKNRVSFDNPKSVNTTNIQGGQDIIILLDEKPFYFIEVKSRWNTSTSVSMSKLQLERSVIEKDRYALCSVDITKYMGQNDRFNLPVDDVIPLSRFVTKIGNSIQPIIEDNLEAEKHQDQSVHLIEYRGIIPQEIIKDGNSFEKFVEFLIDKLSQG